MTEIVYMSDIHLEFGGVQELIDSMTPNGGAILCIAGDLGLLKSPLAIQMFFEEVSEMYKAVVCISGNHEHYNGDISNALVATEGLTKDFQNIYWLEDSTVTIEDIKFIGSTFWSEIDADPYVRNQIQYGMNDFRIIKHYNERFTPENAVAIHRKSIDFIFDELDKSFDGKVIVLTHHNPTMRTAEIYRGNALNSAYGTDYEKELEAFGPDLWIYGHTHVSAAYDIGKTKIRCNPRGYWGHELNPEFDSNKTETF